MRVSLPADANFATAPSGVALDCWPPVLEYTSVSRTSTFTSWPVASTWSRPPKPMSYAQPSPPTIHTERGTSASAASAKLGAAVDGTEVLAESLDWRGGARRWLRRRRRHGLGELGDEVGGKLGGESFEERLGASGEGVDTEAQPEAELGVVLEQRVAPRRAAPVASVV